MNKCPAFCLGRPASLKADELGHCFCYSFPCKCSSAGKEQTCKPLQRTLTLASSQAPAPWQCSAGVPKEMHMTRVKTDAVRGAETLSNPPLLPVTASVPRPTLLQHHHQNSPLLLPWLAGLWPYLPRAPVALSSTPTIIWSSELNHQGQSQIHQLVPSHLCSLSSHGLMEFYHLSQKAFSTSTSFGLQSAPSLRAST